MQTTPTIFVQYVRESAKAICVKWSSDTLWLPKSQVEVIARTQGSLAVNVPRWLIEKVRKESQH